VWRPLSLAKIHYFRLKFDAEGADGSSAAILRGRAGARAGGATPLPCPHPRHRAASDQPEGPASAGSKLCLPYSLQSLRAYTAGRVHGRNKGKNKVWHHAGAGAGSCALLEHDSLRAQAYWPAAAAKESFFAQCQAARRVSPHARSPNVVRQRPRLPRSRGPAGTADNTGSSSKAGLRGRARRLGWGPVLCGEACATSHCCLTVPAGRRLIKQGVVVRGASWQRGTLQ
jgi:hypothetical protein